ncbi:restriction endonuclease subunit S [Enterococcus hirae]
MRKLSLSIYDWEQRKFKDFTKISQGLQIAISNRFLNEGKNRLFYITNEFLNPNSSVKYYIENAPETVIANSDDILMTRTGNTGKVVTNVHGAFHNNFFKIAYDKSKTNKLFLFYLLNSNYIQNEIRIGAGSSTIPDLKHPNFYKINVNTTSLEEQTKIGNFFKSLDDTIALHQRKIEKLKLLKQAFLQKMLVNQGNVPELRFTEFEEVWEQHKLGETIDIRSGRDYKHLKSGNIPVYGTGGYMLSVDEALSYDKDAIGIGRKGTIDRPYILKAPFWTVDTLFYAIPRNEYDIDFFYSIFQKVNWKSKDESTGVPSLSKATINSVLIYLPNREEQKKLGTFFKYFDDTIFFHQHKLNYLKQLKTSFLQKMFI